MRLFVLVLLAAVSCTCGQRTDGKTTTTTTKREGRQGAARREGRSRAAAKKEAGPPAPSNGDAGGGLGSGADYLELTETEWDGKTPWFTGSCEWSHL